MHSRCCVHDVQNGERFLISAVALPQLPQVHIHCDNVIEHLGMSNSHLSPSWRLLHPITRITREMFQGFSRFVAYLRFTKEFLHLLYWMGVPGSGGLCRCPSCVHEDTVPVVPIFPAQVRETPKRASTHFDSHLPSHPALVGVAANDSLSHECPDEHTAHIDDDTHLQRCNSRTDCISTSGGFQVFKICLVWVFDSVASSSLLFIIFT